jgi:hypothetical protein
LKAAKQIGLTIPQRLLLKADQVLSDGSKAAVAGLKLISQSTQSPKFV